MSLLKKAVLIILLALAAMMPCMADSYTLSTRINNVNWLSGFGWGLFPVGTYFEYKTGFHPFDSLTHGAEYSIELSFDMASPSYVHGARSQRMNVVHQYSLCYRLSEAVGGTRRNGHRMPMGDS